MGRYKGGQVDAFIFDLDGTLIDSGLDIAMSANFTRVHFGLGEIPVPTAVGYVGDGVAQLLWRVLGHDLRSGLTEAAGLPVNENMHAEAMGVFADHYGRHLLDHTALYPGVRDVLARYRRIPMFLATNKPRRFTDPILQGLHLAEAFTGIVAGDETPARKPDPVHLGRCLEGHDFDVARVVVVGDSPNDILAARSLGAIAVGCTYGLTAPGLIRSANPNFLLGEISELAALFPSRKDLAS